MSFALAAQHWHFDHVGVVVKTLDRGRKHFVHALGVSDWTDPIEDPVNGVHLQFGRDGSGMVYELVAPLDTGSPVAGALAARKNLLNHVAYRVPDLAEAAAGLREARCFPTAEPKPAIAFGGAMIQFFVTPIDTIVELIEAPDFAHDFISHYAIQGV
ncbi:MAG TPA: VOC family protein [Sphingomonas sp.]|nr:VOC family protein [Sphingomonas sp.]